MTQLLHYFSLRSHRYGCSDAGRYTGTTSNQHEVTCQACLSNPSYQSDLIELELAYEGSRQAWVRACSRWQGVARLAFLTRS